MSSTEGTYQAGHAISRCAGQVLSALAEVSSTPTWSMTPDEQRSTLISLTQLQARITELRLRVLAGADNNQVGKDTGASSTGAWLADATKQVRADANADVRIA